MSIKNFLENHFFSYNARYVRDAARAYEKHIADGGKMMLSLAGAMSTARLGKILSRAIRGGLVHAVSCTGANLEEDAFNLLHGPEYAIIPEWRNLTPADDAKLLDRGLNRVTDACIPEHVMLYVTDRLITRWRDACQAGHTAPPASFLIDVLKDPEVAARYQRPDESWLLAADEKSIPIWTPGWEDSTTGNMFTASVINGKVPDHCAVEAGTRQMQRLVSWYTDNCKPAPGTGFFQIGGGIAGDFAICVVPLISQDLRRTDIPRWGYFCQISDAVTSYGGYSGATASEKISWGKLHPDTPMFQIQSDATIVAPLIFGYLLGD